MHINCRCNAEKMATNTSRHNFACNNLEYNKLKASGLTLHVIKSKAKNYIVHKLSILKIVRYIELENF